MAYDQNGNITALFRTDAEGNTIDNLVYNYNTSGGKLLNNRLRHVDDFAGVTAMTEDLEDQGVDNYGYDRIGNLTSDVSEGIGANGIQWSVYGKILKITKSGNDILYTYDAAGNRISKTVGGITTWYVRDASGNVMGIYEKGSRDLNGGDLTQSEIHLYGSSRLGIVNTKRNVEHPFVAVNGINTFERGNKFFELSNHLGSVLVTISDKKIGVDNNSDGTIDYYEADVITAQDYYPFGQLEPGRQYGALGRYGFNGKEQDAEVKGNGAQYDYGFRIYDPRLGRFLSVDPLTKDYPWYTPYSFAGNKPIWATDLDGLEENTTSTYVKPPIILPPAKPKAENSFTQQSFSLKPTLQQGSDVLASVKARQNQQIALRQTVIAPKAQVPQNGTTVSAYNPTEYQKQQSAEYARQAQIYKNLQGATMDPFAAQVTLSTYVTAQTYVNGVVEHGKGIVQGIQEGNYWSAAGNAALLALDASPFFLKGSTTAVTTNIPSRLARIIPEEFAGSPTLGASGAADVFVIDASTLKGITNSTDLAKRLTLLDANGNLIKGPFRVIEFDTPSSGLASPFNRTNPGFINGGKTAGGASEYVLPNLQVNQLKNVTQTTIK